MAPPFKTQGQGAGEMWGLMGLSKLRHMERTCSSRLSFLALRGGTHMGLMIFS